MQASTLIDRIRRDLEKVNRQLLKHSYVESIEQGKIPREKLRPFAGEQYAIIRSDLRSVAHLVTRFGSSPSRDFFLGILEGEKAALEALHYFARALGLGETDLDLYEPIPGAHAYTAYMAWLALYGSEAQVAAGYLVNFPAWGMNCGRLSRALKDRFEMNEEQVRFFDLFAVPPPTFEAHASAVIQHGLDRGEDPRLIGRAARLLQAYELMYWDALHHASVGS
ncbi:MAG: transcriptional regulator [Nitrospiraceae bacterium]